MHQPLGFKDETKPDHVCLLHKALYGLKQAPRAWYQRFATFATRVGFKQSNCDSSLFVHHNRSDIAYLLLYVDDILLTASSSALRDSIIASLNVEFTMTDLRQLHYFLGITIKYNKANLFLQQKTYAMEILQRANMSECNSCTTPADARGKLSDEGSPPMSDPTLYRSLAGALQYLTFTRSDIAFAVQHVSLFMYAPLDSHYNALKRILRYIKGTLDHGLQLTPNTSHTLTAYSDADWPGCPNTRQSTSGYCIFHGDNLISWSSKRQQTVSRSSAEAEYRGVANDVSEVTWIRNLMLELYCPLRTATIVYCDNVSAVYLSTNPVQHQRMKHVEIDTHFVRKRIAIGHVRVIHVPSSQYADIFTKGLHSPLFLDFKSSLRVSKDPTSTAGE
ncbi:uncharacterized mitochondrial protein AtMg00810-like [Brassica napus]|uniref:uncharacterized mitochondrial protein AtMg00810-like n=1 Tax=Brassica napus TaxID=3708 RepID=UPI0020796801|nr:uncharacterized mitochondrial protein AtMg00810-like [Brassica napus]